MIYPLNGSFYFADTTSIHARSSTAHSAMIITRSHPPRKLIAPATVKMTKRDSVYQTRLGIPNETQYTTALHGVPTFSASNYTHSSKQTPTLHATMKSYPARTHKHARARAHCDTVNRISPRDEATIGLALSGLFSRARALAEA